MKHQWKGFIAGMLVTLLLVGSVGTAMATTGKKAVEITYNNISVTLDGQPVSLKDANGNPVEPFMLSGTNYLPVRAVAEALGLEVAWDGATQTVILTRPTTTQPAPDPASTPAPTQQLIRGQSPDTIVYVSTASNTVHSVHDCSGMRNYREMTIYDATAQGYQFCPNCW